MRTPQKLEKPNRALLYRSRCMELLKRESHRPLVTLIAPTGYGKTSLMEIFASSIVPDNGVVWLTLENADNDPRHFLNRLNAALPSHGRTPAEPQLESVAEFLDGERETHLFFDQYEAIRNQDIHDMLTDLFLRTSANVRFYIAGRDKTPFHSDDRIPHSKLLSLTQEHLRLDMLELAQLVKAHAEIVLDNEIAEKLNQRTEGWFPAVQSYISCIDGSKASFMSPSAALRLLESEAHDLFLHRVFLRQSPELQQFMLLTSIPECFDDDLGQSLTRDPRHHEKTERLLESQLFLTQDANGHCRYHPLFSNFLRNRLRQTDKERFHALYERYGEWLEEKGRILEAVQHWLNRSDYDHAARAVLADIPALFTNANHKVLRTLDAFPSKELYRRPSVAILYAWFLISDQRISSAETVLLQIESEMQDEQKYVFALTGEDVRGYIASFHSIIYFLRHDKEKGAAFMQETESRLNGRGLIYCHTSSINKPVSSLFKSAFGHWGTLDQSIAMCEYAEENWRGDNRGYGYFQALLGECYYERNRLAEAEKCLVKGRRIGLDLLDIGLLLPTTLTMVRMKQQQGMYSNSQLLLDETRSRLGDRLEPEGKRLLDACQIRLIMGSNESDPVSRWVAEHGHHANETLDHNRMYEYLTLLRAFLYLRQYEQGISFGEKLLQYSQSLYRFYYKAEIHLLLAFLSDQSKATPSAVNHLEQALEIGQQEGYFRLFLNEWDRAMPLFTKYGQQLRLTTAFHDHLLQQSEEAAIDFGEQNRAFERLTPSESKVLKLLIEGRSNAFIADRLSNSIETVKSHCKSIYKKLELKNREEVRTYFEKTY